MAEPGIFSGVFPDGILGRRNVRHNRGLIENIAERILGDEQARADLEQMGQLGSVELLIDRGLKAPRRSEQQPVLDALGQIVDGLGLWERDRIEAGRLDQRINESLAAAAGFVGPEQLEQIAQLADEAYRAYEQSQYSPSQGMESYRALTEKVQSVVDEASSNLRSTFIDPLRAIEADTAASREQLLQSSGGNLDARATPQEVLQVLNQLGSATSEELGGLSLSIPGIGGFGPDDVPDMTYGELLNALESNLKGRQQYVANELERRGAGVLAVSPMSYVPTPRTDRLASEAELSGMIEQALAEPEQGGAEPNAVRQVASDYGTAVQDWMQRYPGAQLDAENTQLVTPEGRRIPAPPNARTLLEQIRRRARNRRATND